MESKKIIWFCMIVGSGIGGFVPMIWGESAFSMMSILLTAVGGFVGIWVGYRMSL